MNREYDLLVIGTGVSGLSCALAAAEEGRSVAIISKESVISECNTRYAQGGIVASGEKDSPARLTRDIMEAGDNVNCRAAVELLSAEGPAFVEKFLVERLAVPFSRTADGKVARTQEAAHSVRRIFFAKDETGKAIETSLLEAVSKNKKITVFPSHAAIDLITTTHNSTDPQDRYAETRVLGAYVWDRASSEVEIFFSPAVVLATGGIGNLFLHTSNPPGATGDGIAMARRIGVEVLNAEYVQFHPTVLFHKDIKRFLISETVRGEGAALLNHAGERFMTRYHPELADLAPRDEVARAMYREMENEGSEYLLLDATRITNLSLEDRFPSIFSTCLRGGLDMRKEPIPVVPAAHYFCGGVKVALQGQSSVPGLYAVGETACTGVHGANRLASVSLLEGLFFGWRAGKDASRNLAPVPARARKHVPEWVYPSHPEEFDPVLIQQDMQLIQSTMWNYAGVIRTRKRLLRALADINYLGHRIEQFYREARITRSIIELRNAVEAAGIVVSAAYSNTSSRGCHYVEP